MAKNINMKKETETINKGQEEMKNVISELKIIVAKEMISELEDKVEKNNLRAKQGKEAEKE